MLDTQRDPGRYAAGPPSIHTNVRRQTSGYSQLFTQ